MVRAALRLSDSNYRRSERKNTKKYIAYFLKENFRHPPKIDYTELTNTNTHAITYSLSVSLLEIFQKCSGKDNVLHNSNMKKVVSAHEM